MRNKKLSDEALCMVGHVIAIWDLVVQFADGFRVVLRLRRGFERKDAEQHLHQQNSKAPAVGPEVILVSLDHLVRIVAWRACSPLEAGGTHLHCEAEITEEDFAIIVDHDVLGLDVAVQDPFCVASLESGQKLDEYGMTRRFREVAFRLLLLSHVPVQVSAADVGEDHDDFLLANDELAQRHDVWLILQLVVEFAFKSDIVDQVLFNNLVAVHALETDDLLGLCMAGNTDDSNHSASDDATDSVVSNLSIDLLLGDLLMPSLLVLSIHSISSSKLRLEQSEGLLLNDKFIWTRHSLWLGNRCLSE